MVKGLTVFQAIWNHVERRPRATAARIARDILRSVAPENLEDFVFPLLRREIDHAQRGVMHDIERDAAGVWQSTNSRRVLLAEGCEIPPDWCIWRESLRDAQFKLDGEIIRWWDATIEQHEERVAWFDAHIDGCVRTRENHARAIDVLRRAGVRCLADLKPEAA